MSLVQNRSSLLTAVAVALLAAACRGSGALQSPLSPTAVTGSTTALAGDTLQAPRSDTAITALGKGGSRSGGDDEQKSRDDKGKSGGGGGSGSDDGRERSGDREPARVTVTLSGFVTSVSASTLTVHGVEVAVGASTVIRHGNRTLTLADIRVGNHAQVKGTQVGGLITASEVKVEDTGRDDEDDDDGLPRVALTGAVSGLGSTLTCPIVTFTIGGTSVTTSVATVFSGAPCASLADGQSVDVKATRRIDGTLLVQRVSVDGDDEAEGVTSVPSGTCPTLAFSVGVTPVTTSATTVFRGVTCEQIAAGVAVKVDVAGTRMAGGSLAAAVVELD